MQATYKPHLGDDGELQSLDLTISDARTNVRVSAAPEGVYIYVEGKIIAQIDLTLFGETPEAIEEIGANPENAECPRILIYPSEYQSPIGEVVFRKNEIVMIVEGVCSPKHVYMMNDWSAADQALIVRTDRA